MLGASPKPDRTSFQAVRLLKEHGFHPIPVHPAGHAVDSVPGVSSLDEVAPPPDTLTVYVNAGISSDLRDAMLRLRPRRVIFNPGAENDDLAAELRAQGIEVVEACTLVMLRTGVF
ncbi:MAG: CoA-binding protein [candidate division Zixibacteria bacterium]|nr:CoA-binding protein [candidate division Zixibacteria bacterium]